MLKILPNKKDEKLQSKASNPGLHRILSLADFVSSTKQPCGYREFVSRTYESNKSNNTQLILNHPSAMNFKLMAGTCTLFHFRCYLRKNLVWVTYQYHANAEAKTPSSKPESSTQKERLEEEVEPSINRSNSLNNKCLHKRTQPNYWQGKMLQ